MTNWHTLEGKPIINAKYSEEGQKVKDILNLVLKNKRINTDYSEPTARFSKLPMCGLLHTLDILDDSKKYIDYSTDFFTEIGTVVHSIMQRHFPLTKNVSQYVFGNWKCKNCNHLLKLCTTPKCCPKCFLKAMSYSEIEINFKGVFGHIDLILFIDGKYYLIDFKTTSEYNISHPKRYIPYPKHLIQVESYVVGMKEVYDIKIKDFFLIYISRSTTDLEIQNFINSSRPFVIKHFQMNLRKYSNRLQRLDEIARVNKISQRLLRNPTKENLKLLQDSRPCMSLEDYNDKQEGMVNGFFANSECPYLEGRTCFKQVKWTAPAQKIWDLLNN
jgi:hypothetical protein